MTYRLVDGLGSTVNLCDEDGELVGEYSYDAYGNVRAQSGDETEFSFAGEQSDPNGLDFLRARYYDPEIGRFLGRDPLGGGYGYVLGNPVNLTDPSGLVPAGTCLSFDNSRHVWTPCSDSDAEGLIGDLWWENYIADSIAGGIARFIIPPSCRCDTQPSPSDFVFEEAVDHAENKKAGCSFICRVSGGVTDVADSVGGAIGDAVGAVVDTVAANPADCAGLAFDVGTVFAEASYFGQAFAYYLQTQAAYLDFATRDKLGLALDGLALATAPAATVPVWGQAVAIAGATPSTIYSLGGCVGLF
jgi:RHS repeat-associated protein